MDFNVKLIKPQTFSVKATNIIKIEPPQESITVKSTGTKQVIVATDKLFNKITVDEFKLQDKVVVPTSKEQIIQPDEGYDALKVVSVGAIPKDMLQQMVDQTTTLSMFKNFTGTKLELSSLDVSHITNGEQAFNYCTNLETLDIRGWTPHFQNSLANIFSNCRKLKTLDLNTWDVSNVMYLNYAFYQCYALETLNINNWDVSNVTNLSATFEYCYNLTALDVSKWDISKVTSLLYTFADCQALQTLDVSNWNTSNVTNMNHMFSYCRKLTSLDLSNWNTSKVTDMSYMFNNCSDLTNIIGEINLLNVTKVNSMFYYCNALQTVTLKNIKINLQIGSGTSYGTKLTTDTLTNTIQELWDNTGETTAKTLTVSTTSKGILDTLYVKLIPITDEMRANDPYIDNKKPFEICESTDEGAMLITDYATTQKNWTITA